MTSTPIRGVRIPDPLWTATYLHTDHGAEIRTRTVTEWTAK